jgi:hypothetical protein
MESRISNELNDKRLKKIAILTRNEKNGIYKEKLEKQSLIMFFNDDLLKLNEILKNLTKINILSIFKYSKKEIYYIINNSELFNEDVIILITNFFNNFQFKESILLEKNTTDYFKLIESNINNSLNEYENNKNKEIFKNHINEIKFNFFLIFKLYINKNYINLYLKFKNYLILKKKSIMDFEYIFNSIEDNNFTDINEFFKNVTQDSLDQSYLYPLFNFI